LLRFRKKTVRDNAAYHAVVEARENVLDDPEKYKYSDWRYCAVGHIYKAVTGSYAKETVQVTSNRPNEFNAVMHKINTALGKPFYGGAVDPLSTEAGRKRFQMEGDPFRYGSGSWDTSSQARENAVAAYDLVLKELGPVKKKDSAHEAPLKA
jgi:hypothetical protein